VASTFPDGFLWGAATASHQVEGNNVNNDYWQWEHAPHSPFAEPSGDAVDHYHRWREDLDLVAAAGLTSYRFSLEWSRIEPEEGEVSRAEIAHYTRMVDGCRERGLAPIVTLNHFSLPRWMANDGGWASPKAADRFARFTEIALPIVKDAAYVVTLNEPNLASCLPVLGEMARRGEKIAGLPLPDQRIAETLISMHRRSVEVLQGAGAPPSGYVLVGQEYIAEEGGDEQMVRYRAAMEDQFFAATEGDDFVGLQVYSCARLGPDGPVEKPGAQVTGAHVEYRPQALGVAIRRASEMMPNVPIVVTENGIATTDDAERIVFTQVALETLHAAIQDGAEVRGYIHWSLLDNFEWFSGFGPTFGLVAVNRETFERHPKPSLGWLGEVAQRNGLV
jgi:beta-glucosidase